MRRMIYVGLIALSIAVLPVQAQSGGSGNGVGNGGGFAICPDQNLYAYDSLLTQTHQEFGTDVPVANVYGSLARISAELKALRDPLALEFDLFLNSLFRQAPGSKYQWFPQNGLPLLLEPDLDASLPRVCRKRVQAVYYFAPFAGVPYSAYKYDPNLINQVARQNGGAIQLSYLLVHEWLWNFFKREDFMKLAIFNRLLHSEHLNRMSPSEFSRYRPHP